MFRRNGFALKQFSVVRDRCMMKMGTDGILLGAWAPVAGVKRYLNIGAGSGLLTLMLARRASNDVIADTAELENEAVAQAWENVNQSSWAERIGVHATDVQQWTTRQTICFDLVINNPPYYQQGVGCVASQREQTHYATTLDHPSLLIYAAECIAEEGFFCAVPPEQTGNSSTELALSIGWHLCLRTGVTENEARLPYRVLLAFSPQTGKCLSDRLVIHGPDQNYSEVYTALTQVLHLFV